YAEDDDQGIGRIRIGVPFANDPGVNATPPTVIDPDFVTRQVAVGTDPLENPSGVITFFGFLSTGVPTEPDENTYLKTDASLVCNGVNYGRNFLFQGHENAGNLAYATRINLDIPSGSAHRITLLTPVGQDGLTHFNAIDGSTYDPFTNTMLFTQEAGANGGVI